MIHNHLRMADDVCLDNDENLQLVLSVQKNQVTADAVTCSADNSHVTVH